MLIPPGEIDLICREALQKQARDLYTRYIGKYVICRSHNEGVNAGKVIAIDESGVNLEDSRRLYYHEPKDKLVSWYEGVAETGLSSDSKVSSPVEKLIVEPYSLTSCSPEAENSIREFKTHEQEIARTK